MIRMLISPKVELTLCVFFRSFAGDFVRPGFGQSAARGRVPEPAHLGHDERRQSVDLRLVASLRGHAALHSRGSAVCRRIRRAREAAHRTLTFLQLYDTLERRQPPVRRMRVKVGCSHEEVTTKIRRRATSRGI